MFGKAAVEKERQFLRRIALEVITEKLLVCESAMELGETVGAVTMARELGLITLAEKKAYEKKADDKHFAFLKRKEEERKAKSAQYKAERAAKAKAAKENS